MKKVLMIIALVMTANTVPASTLSDVASQMQAGTWAPVTQTNIGSVLGGGAHTGNLSPYAMSAAWDQGAKRLHFLGGDHGCGGGSSHVYYDAAVNAWTMLGSVSGFGGCHGWDHITINPETRTLYFSPYNYGTIAVSRYSPSSGGPWTFVGNAPATAYVNITRGMAWFEGALTGAGSKGALIVYNCGPNNGELLIYDPEKNQWIADIKGFGGTGTYHGFCEYSRVHNVAILGGGNLNPRKVWRLNADRTVTALTDAPVDLGIQRANVAPDPVTGNFLAMGYGQLWELDPRGSGTWIQQTGTRVPPTAVGNPGNPDLNSVFSSEIPEYGVDVYVTCRIANCNMYLYKHTGSTEAESKKKAEAKEKGRITVTPNPVRDRAFIRVHQGSFLKYAAVYDIRGNRIAIIGRNGIWNAAGVPAGVYLVKAMAGNRVLSRRIVVE